MTGRVATRIGSGSAFDDDRLDWAKDMATSGLVDFLSFDCLAERSLALAHVRRQRDPSAGYDQRMERLAELIIEFVSRGGKVAGNFGSANPAGAGRVVIDALRAKGVSGINVAVVTGDDVLSQVRKHDLDLPERGCRVSDVSDQIVAANAYIGIDPIVSAFQHGAHIVVGGRIADPSLWVAPVCFEREWALDDWDRIAVATAGAHLLECGVHVTGGNYADPPFRSADDLVHLSFPLAEIEEESVVVSKLPGSGGVVNTETIKLQLAYEIHDPTNYLTPDIAADFSQAEVVEIGENRVRVSGITGRTRPRTLKVLVGLDLGWKAVGEVSLGGPNCLSRAQLCAEIVRGRLEAFGADIEELRTDIIGYNSLYGDQLRTNEPAEVRLRVAARCHTKEAADAVAYEARYQVFNVAAVSGNVSQSVIPHIGVTPAFLHRDEIPVGFEMLTS
jgi:hypothetical protein